MKQDPAHKATSSAPAKASGPAPSDLNQDRAQTPLPPPLVKKRSRAPLLFSGGVVLTLIGLMVFGNANNNLVYYVLPSEYIAEKERFEGRNLRLGGLATDVQYDRNTLDLRFTVTDGQAAFPVRYTGAVPDLFAEDAVVVMEGRMQGGNEPYFQGQTLLVKHSEEYRADTSGNYGTEDLRRILEEGETL